MDWQELNCVIEALEVLIEKYNIQLASNKLDEDEYSDITNDKSYSEILLSNYLEKKVAFSPFKKEDVT